MSVCVSGVCVSVREVCGVICVSKCVVVLCVCDVCVVCV